MKKLIYLFLLITFLLLPKKAIAQTIDVGVYPPLIQVQSEQPSDIKVPLVLQNYRDESVELNISMKPFVPSENENGEINFTDNPNYEDPFIFQRVIILDNDEKINSVTISPNSTKELVVEFQIPGNEPKGEYYFTIVFTSKNGTSETSYTGAQASIGVNVLLTVGKLGKAQGVLEEFSSPFFITKGPVAFNVRVRNMSDHFVTPRGDILITNMFGQTIGKVNLLQENILSNSIRRIPDVLQAGLKEGDYEKVKEAVLKNKNPVAVWPEMFLLGPYKATLTLSLSDEGPIFRKTIHFFAFPVEYIIGVLVLIGLVSFIILRVRRKIT